MSDNVLCDDPIQTRAASTKGPEQVLVFGVVGYQNLTFSRDNPHLENMARCEAISAGEGAMATTLNVTAQSNTRILASGNHSSVLEGFVEYISPLLTTAHNEYVLKGIFARVQPGPIALKLAQVMSPDR